MIYKVSLSRSGVYGFRSNKMSFDRAAALALCCSVGCGNLDKWELGPGLEPFKQVVALFSSSQSSDLVREYALSVEVKALVPVFPSVKVC